MQTFAVAACVALTAATAATKLTFEGSGNEAVISYDGTDLTIPGYSLASVTTARMDQLETKIDTKFDLLSARLDAIQLTPGATGATGAKGAIGANGAAGTDGTDGAKGEIGALGQKGTDGAKGDIGALGQKGAKGEEGLIPVPIATDCTGQANGVVATQSGDMYCDDGWTMIMKFDGDSQLGYHVSVLGVLTDSTQNWRHVYLCIQTNTAHFAGRTVDQHELAQRRRPQPQQRRREVQHLQHAFSQQLPCHFPGFGQCLHVQHGRDESYLHRSPTLQWG